ncbi:MAG: hypothetical protein ACLQK4_05600 [Acidimicrobiales bacterium]
MTTIARRITGGLTHLEIHVAAALDERGAMLGSRAPRRHLPATGHCAPG